jgi:heme exporter protein A
VTHDFTRIAVADVGRWFGRRKALAGVTFECQAGDIVGLLGPNGAGKSTLLAILATLLEPSTGRVAYGNVTAPEGGPGLRARLGVLGHDLYLYPELTARENLTFFGKLYKLPKVAQRVDEALETAGLSSRADEPVQRFSRGMRQRVALERALLHQPRLLLLDEPFTGLDQASASTLVARLRGLQAPGTVVVVATHDLDVAEGLLTRALFLRNGRVVADETGSAGLRRRYLDLISAS